jgi:hypothetical protein
MYGADSAFAKAADQLLLVEWEMNEEEADEQRWLYYSLSERVFSTVLMG